MADPTLDIETRRALAGEHTGRGGKRGSTSDLSVDEVLLLHSVGWEPTDIVTGAAVAAMLPTTFMIGASDPDRASQAYTVAVASAVDRLEAECRQQHGVGVVGVELDVEVGHHLIEVVMTGTAVRPVSGTDRHPFVSDLSARDFCLLEQAGWEPVGLAFGASFVRVPRRSAGQALRQSTANVELTNMTTALYEAREEGMERMQSSALALGGTGMVDVNVLERPLPFNSHIVEFRVWGTAIRLGRESHRYLRPRVILPLDDRSSLFNVQALGAR
jgi:uncharacterized protein YbjQ (UPF0145 family)